MSKRKLSGRAARRAQDRDAEKLARDVRRLEALEPGGRPEAPVRLQSAAEVEVTATSRPCPICGDALRIVSHDAIEHPAAGRLRVVRLVCRGCRAEWTRHYRLGPPPPN